MNNKDLQKEIIKLYLTIFMDLSNYDNFIFKDTRTYADYEDYINNYYISPEYKLINSDGKFRFYIKKHWFNIRVEVRTEPSIEFDNYGERFNIFRDTLHLKRKSKIKTKIKDIINYVDYNIIMRKVNGSISFARKIKIKKIKEKLK